MKTTSRNAKDQKKNEVYGFNKLQLNVQTFNETLKHIIHNVDSPMSVLTLKDLPARSRSTF